MYLIVTNFVCIFFAYLSWIFSALTKFCRRMPQLYLPNLFNIPAYHKVWADPEHPKHRVEKILNPPGFKLGSPVQPTRQRWLLFWIKLQRCECFSFLFILDLRAFFLFVFSQVGMFPVIEKKKILWILLAAIERCP